MVVGSIVVGAYSLVTDNRARRLRGSTTRGDVGPRNHIVEHSGPSVAGTGPGKVPMFWATLPLHSAVMPLLTKTPLLLWANVLLVLRLQANVQRA